MTGAQLRGRAPLVAGLVGVWTMGWGEVSAANVVSGVVVAVLVLALFPLPSAERAGIHAFRPLQVVHLAGYFVLELIQSNLSMARDLMGRRERMRTGVIGYPLRVQSDTLLTFLANVTALTPGAMPIEADHDPRVLYVHVTRMHERDATTRKLARYEELFLRAFGGPDQLAEIDEADGGEVTR